MLYHDENPDFAEDFDFDEALDLDEDPDFAALKYEIREVIGEQMAAGFLSHVDIAASVASSFAERVALDWGDVEPDILDVLDEIVGTFSQEALLLHLEEQRLWPEVTDCTRLDLAFAELEKCGIVATQNAPCCPTCGGSEVRQELEKHIAQGKLVRGYTYFHEQCTERAIRGDGLGLYFGSIENTAEATTAIGQEVVDTLRRHGLSASWDGTGASCIHVEMDWKRRRPTETEG